MYFTSLDRASWGLYQIYFSTNPGIFSTFSALDFSFWNNEFLPAVFPSAFIILVIIYCYGFVRYFAKKKKSKHILIKKSKQNMHFLLKVTHMPGRFDQIYAVLHARMIDLHAGHCFNWCLARVLAIHYVSCTGCKWYERRASSDPPPPTIYATTTHVKVMSV